MVCERREVACRWRRAEKSSMAIGRTWSLSSSMFSRPTLMRTTRSCRRHVAAGLPPGAPHMAHVDGTCPYLAPPGLLGLDPGRRCGRWRLGLLLGARLLGLVLGGL